MARKKEKRMPVDEPRAKRLPYIPPKDTGASLADLSALVGTVEVVVVPALHAAMEYAGLRGDGGTLVKACNEALKELAKEVKFITGREMILPEAPRRDD